MSAFGLGLLVGLTQGSSHTVCDDDQARPDAEDALRRTVVALRQGLDAHESSGVAILWHRTSDVIVGAYSEYDVLVWESDLEHRERLRPSVSRVLERYPPDVLYRAVQQIAVARRVEINGVPVGGLSKDGLIVVTSEVRRGVARSEESLRAILHAECSSSLIRANPDAWNWAEWEGDARLSEGGIEAIRAERSRSKWDPALYSEGFLTEYGRSSQMNDANSFAVAVMMWSAEIDRVAKDVPAIRRKVEIVRRFYRRLQVL